MKTLLIGLGGTGCQVAAQVMRKIGTAYSGIQFLGFDTDKNWGGVEGLPLVLTSRDAKAGELLKGQKNWHEWFPENQLLMAHPMITGAGQVRVLSRLAFSDTVKHHKAIAELERAIRELNLQRDKNGPEKLRIMIVSSFAGGTGSGMFLQTALFLKKYMRQNYQSDVIIRGVFAMPDLFMGGNFSEKQRESMYANAYASIKELAAINAICVSDDPSLNRYSFKIEDLFDSAQVLREKALASTTGKSVADYRPYDMIFFIDNLNANKNVLNSGDDYIHQIAELTYMQIFSPMVDKMHSREDNYILTHVQTDGKTVYGSAGAAKLIYPYKGILEYCTVRTMQDTISSTWTMLDHAFEQKLAQKREQRRLDRSVKLPERSTELINEIDTQIKNKNRSFEFIRNGIYDTFERKIDGTNESESVETDRTEHVYWRAVLSFIDDQIDGDGTMNSYRERCKIKDDELKPFDDKSSFKGQLEKYEKRLDDYFDKIRDRAETICTSIANSIVPPNLDSAFDDAGKPYNVRSLFEKTEGQAVHPLAQRYMLYRLASLIKEKLAKISGEVKSLSEGVEAYFTTDYDKKQAGIQKIFEVDPGNPLKRMSFIKRYVRGFKEELGLLNDYRSALVTANVLDIISKRITALIAQYEKVFKSLDDVMEDFAGRAAKLEEAFGYDSPNEMYIGAEKEDLKDLYSQISLSGGDDQRSDIYSLILKEVYTTAMERLQANAPSARTKDEDYATQQLNYSISEMFNTSIFESYEKQIAEQNDDLLNIEISKAIDNEAQKRARKLKEKANDASPVTPADISKARRDLLDSICGKASPFLTTSETHDPDPQIAADDGNTDRIDNLFWGFNTLTEQAITRRHRIGAKDYLRISTEPDVIPDPAYSPYELSCYQSIYCVRLSEIPKFSEDEEKPGIFYENYRNRIRKMLDGRFDRTDTALTPHLDIRWHSREYMPMINARKNDEDDRAAARALWYGYYFKAFKEVKNLKTGGFETYVSFVKASNRSVMIEEVYPQRPLRYNAKPVRLSQAYEIFKALQQDTLTTERLLEVYEQRMIDCETLREENYNFTGVSHVNILAKRMIEDAGDLMDSEQTDTEKEVKTEDRSFSLNALEVMRRVATNKQAIDSEVQTVVDEFASIFERLTAKMSDARKHELLTLILAGSQLTSKTKRLGVEIIWDPMFALVMEEYDAKAAKQAKKESTANAKASKTKTESTRKTAKGGTSRKNKKTDSDQTEPNA